MCNLYSNTMAKDAMRQLFAVDAAHDELGNAEPLTAIFPKGMSPIVGTNADGTRWLQQAHWGFVMPQVSKTGKPIQPKAVNNARDDKLRTSRFWTKSFEERRCLIPATSFCEAKGRNPATYVGSVSRARARGRPLLWRASGGPTKAITAAARSAR